MSVDLSSLFTADHLASQSENAQTVTFRKMGRSSTYPAFTVTSAIVGDLQLGENGQIDGLSDTFTTPLIVLRSECPYMPQRGQKVVLASGQVCTIQDVTDGADGVTYPITLVPDA